MREEELNDNVYIGIYFGELSEVEEGKEVELETQPNELRTIQVDKVIEKVEYLGKKLLILEGRPTEKLV